MTNPAKKFYLLCSHCGHRKDTDSVIVDTGMDLPEIENNLANFSCSKCKSKSVVIFSTTLLSKTNSPVTGKRASSRSNQLTRSVIDKINKIGGSGDVMTSGLLLPGSYGSGKKK